MRKALIAVCTLALVAAVPSSAFAWGFVAHRYIMRHAIDILPPPLKPFFDRFREEVIERVTDPDNCRNVGWEDDPNHFVDFGDPVLGPYPFTAFPREYGAAIEKFGMRELKKAGLLHLSVERVVIDFGVKGEIFTAEEVKAANERLVMAELVL